MRVLIIPDVHLKPYMFDKAEEVLKTGKADMAVCLGDLADDFEKQWDIDLYRATYDRAILFSKEFPNTLWCYGNHDLCYIWNQRETGYSKTAPYTVCTKLEELKESLPDPKQIAYIHRIDNVLFCHGGLTEEFCFEYVLNYTEKSTDEVIGEINKFGMAEIWNDLSPVWLRPQYGPLPLYKKDDLLQVVGHTPVMKITRKENLISCDTFSTYRTGEPYGNRCFMILDTKTWDFVSIPSRS